MYDSIINFAHQLSFEPRLENGPINPSFKRLIVAGMGGSHLSADLLALAVPSLDIYVHRTYGLPPLPHSVLPESLFIASSYSGNTEETLDALEQAVSAGLRPAVIASGGKLLTQATARKLPYIKIPDNIIQPRVAVGVSLKALASLAGQKEVLEELMRLSRVIVPSELETEGKRIAGIVAGYTPLIYTSEPNAAIAYNWKIKINETAKTPAFCNVFPELNHNELAGFAKNQKGPGLPLAILFIKDQNDHPRIQKRMAITAELLSESGFIVTEIALSGSTPLERALRSLVIADWTAYHLALAYGVNPDDNPAVEEFKRRMVR